MKKPSEVFNKIRFAKLDPKHEKAGPFSTDDEEHGAVSEIEWNQQLQHQKKRAMQEKVDKPTGELKDACWKGYTAVGMKMKDGKKVPNCVPTNESKDMKAMRIIKDIYKRKSVKEEIEIQEEIAGWIAHYNGQKHEIKKHEAKDLYDAKQKAIAHFKAPKSKHGLIAVKPAYNEEVEQVEEGMMKRMATDAEENKRLGSWKKETPWMKSKGTVTDKSGAKHTAMSTARDLARKAAQKNVKESVSITESRLADIVREAAEKAKKKKKEETKKSDDTFQAEPELSSQIIRND
jgi:hypothetical protein